MSAADHLTDEQFERRAFELLQREFGVDGLARFLRLHRSGSGDYTRERAELFRNLSLDEILESIRQRRERPGE